MPFHSTTQGFSATPGQPLPTLNLPRVFVLTGPDTCSASESIINSLRGIGVEVVQIGSTTCGKPYGFYPQDNCGTTYFSIEFRGVNAMNFGDYPTASRRPTRPRAHRSAGRCPAARWPTISPTRSAIRPRRGWRRRSITAPRTATPARRRHGLRRCCAPRGRCRRSMALLPPSPLRQMRILGCCAYAVVRGAAARGAPRAAPCSQAAPASARA